MSSQTLLGKDDTPTVTPPELFSAMKFIREGRARTGMGRAEVKPYLPLALALNASSGVCISSSHQVQLELLFSATGCCTAMPGMKAELVS